MRTILAATAAALAILAAAASAIAGDSDLVAFFVVLVAVATTVVALAAGQWVGTPRNIARLLALKARLTEASTVTSAEYSPT